MNLQNIVMECVLEIHTNSLEEGGAHETQKEEKNSCKIHLKETREILYCLQEKQKTFFISEFLSYEYCQPLTQYLSFTFNNFDRSTLDISG